LLEPVDHDVMITGFASTPDRDRQFMKFRSRSLFWPRKEIPLRYCHGEEAGTIEELHYDGHGRLLVCARVNHPQARRAPAFSVAATVEKWELRNVDDPQTFHALITQATLDEVSLTDKPCNPHALVRSRLCAPPSPSFHELMIKRVKCAIAMVDIVKTTYATTPANSAHGHGLPAPDGKSVACDRFDRAPKPRRQSDFSKLVAAMNQRAELSHDRA
jgi:hypothetical protein